MAKHKKSTIINKGSDKPNADKSRHYVDNKEFLAALEERCNQIKKAEAAGKPKPQVSEYIGECIVKIAEGVSKHKSFRQKPYLDDMVGDAIHNCIRYVDNFNPEITKNPFAYFTQICSYAFLHRIGVEEKNTVVKFKSILNSISQTDHVDIDSGNEATEAKHALDNFIDPEDYMAEYVARFEEKQRKLKEKTKKKAKEKKGLLKKIKSKEENEDD